MKRKVIGVIGTAGIPARYGGFETLVEYLVEYLATKFDFIVYSSSFGYPEKLSSYKGAKLIYLPIRANGKSSIFYDTLSMLHSIFVADIILVLGVGGAFLIPFLRFVARKKVIANIDGLEWKRDKWGKLAKTYLHVQEFIAVKFSHVVIADNEAIQQYILEKYGRESELIAYGGSHAFNSVLKQEIREKYKIESPYAFTVCRIEPENNIHVILEAFSQANRNFVIVGNWSSSAYGVELLKKYGPFGNIKMLEPIYEQAELNEIRSNCALYVHGHSAGGTNPSLVEAMWMGLPVVAWNVAYNVFTTENKAAFFSSAEQLRQLLDALSEDDLQRMRTELREVALRKYSWDAISNRYEKVFNAM